MPRAVELLQEIGFPVLLLLLIAAMVVPLIVWRVWRASPRLGKLLSLVIVLWTVTFAVAKSVSPAGKYAVGDCRGPGSKHWGFLMSITCFQGECTTMSSTDMLVAWAHTTERMISGFCGWIVKTMSSMSRS